MKVLLTGASGQLGQALIKTKPSGIELNCIFRKDLNLLDLKSCYEAILKISPDWIINCAAYTNVDKAEKESKIAFAINKDVPQAFSKALLKTGGKIMQISTDYVFDGKKNSPYKIDDIKNPLNIYGKSKAEGEKEILDILGENNQSVIIRTSWLMGPVGNNFLRTMLKLHSKDKEIKVISDQVGCPTSTFSLSKFCWKTINNFSQPGYNMLFRPLIMHWSESGVASWYDISIAIGEIAEELGLIRKQSNVIPIPTRDFKSIAIRPNYSLLDCYESQKHINMYPLHWRRSIRSTLKTILNTNST